MTGSVRLALLGILIALPACRDVTAPQNVGEARALWDSRQISSYTFVASRVCFCVVGPEPVQVVVIDNQVVRVMSLATGAEIPNYGWLTVNEYFDRLASGAWQARQVTFDAALGYPTKIDICCIEDDSGVVYRIGNLAQIGVLQ
jgi:hypothetical protein